MKPSELTRAYRVPREVNGTPTDVVSVGRLVLHLRPVELGASISRVNGLPGSMACIVAKSSDSKWYFLSAAHVLATDFAATIGDEIDEPAGASGKDAAFGRVVDFEALQPDGVRNVMDAGLAVLLRKSDVTNDLPMIGPVERKPIESLLYESVRKFGAKTGHTLGIVTAASVQISLQNPLTGDSYLYDQVMEVTGAGSDFSAGGDSGALVVDALTSRPVGLIIGGAAADVYHADRACAKAVWGVGRRYRWARQNYGSPPTKLTAKEQVR